MPGRPTSAPLTVSSPVGDRAGGPSKRALVVHLIPADLSRGAQVYLSALLGLLADGPREHRVVSLFDAPEQHLGRHLSLGVRSGRLRRVGLDPRGVARLRQLLGHLEPAVVIAHGGEVLKYAALTRTATPIVYYKIGCVTPQARTGLRRWFQRWLAGRATVVAAVSRDVAREAETVLGVPPDRVRVVQNGRDPAQYTHPMRRAESDLGVIFVGHLATSKRPDLFIEVVRRLRRGGFSGPATLVGEGPLERRLQPAARAADVTMLGRRHDVPELLGSAELFVFTSIAAGEGMPGVLIEASLAGLPVVTTDVPGARDVVIDGATGVVCPVDNLAELVSACQRLIDDEGLREAMGRAGSAHCRQHFSLAASARAWEALLAELPAPTSASGRAG